MTIAADANGLPIDQAAIDAANASAAAAAQAAAHQSAVNIGMWAVILGGAAWWYWKEGRKIV